MGRKGKVFAKTDKTEGGRETGRLAIWAPHGTGRRHGTGAGAGRGGRIQRETLENAKKDYTAQGTMPGGKGEETGRHRKRGPPETQKGRTRKAGRAGWKTRKGTPEPPESPDGRGKGRKRKGEGARAPPPPHCKGKGKKSGMQTGKEKTGQKKVSPIRPTDAKSYILRKNRVHNSVNKSKWKDYHSAWLVLIFTATSYSS